MAPRRDTDRARRAASDTEFTPMHERSPKGAGRGGRKSAPAPVTEGPAWPRGWRQSNRNPISHLHRQLHPVRAGGVLASGTPAQLAPPTRGGHERHTRDMPHGSSAHPHRTGLSLRVVLLQYWHDPILPGWITPSEKPGQFIATGLPFKPRPRDQPVTGGIRPGQPVLRINGARRVSYTGKATSRTTRAEQAVRRGVWWERGVDARAGLSGF
jgi:hypothetical protein